MNDENASTQAGAVARLRDAGGILFACDAKTKRPLSTPKDAKWDSRELREAVRNQDPGELPGIVPGTLGGGFIVFDGDTDTDEDRAAALAALRTDLGEPWLLLSTSKPNRFHAWYAVRVVEGGNDHATAIGQPYWRYGETRCAKGYICLHGDAAAHLADAMAATPPGVALTPERVKTFCALHPKPKSPKRGPPSRDGAQGALADLESDCAAENAGAAAGSRRRAAASGIADGISGPTTLGKGSATGKAAPRKSNGTTVRTRPCAPPNAKFTGAVGFLDPEHLGEAVDYDDWLKVGFAIHHETGGHEDGFVLWDEFSRQFANYPSGSEQTTHQKWESFAGSTQRPVTAGSIYKMARALGWKDPTRRTKRDAAVAEGAFPAKNARALRLALERLDIQLRLNERSAWPEFRRGTGPWETPDDAYSAALREEVAERFCYVSENRGETVPLRFGRDAWWDAINALLHEHRVDPFLHWLDALTGWDGTPRLDTWLEQCWQFPSGVDSCRATPLPLVRWAAQHLLLGPIWRAQEPGCKLDEMVVLVGPAGTGKSTAMPFLFPPEYRRDWFSDQFDFLEKRQARTESLLGSVIVEASEMAGSTRAENAAIKAFLSGTFDRVRLAYRRDPQNLPRRCILVGTGDHDDVLPNDSNLRRFVVVRVQARGTAAETVARVRRFLDENREQLWAEACVRFKAGAQAHLPPELASSQRAVAEDYRYRNESVENALVEIKPDRVRDGVTISKLIAFTGLPESSEVAVAKGLRALGWTKSRQRARDGGRRTLWFPPEPGSGQGGHGGQGVS